MNVPSTCVLIVSLAVLAAGCSTKTEPGPDVLPVVAPAEAPPPMPIEHRSPQGVDADPGHAKEKLTLEEIMVPAEAPPPAPTDHRLRLGIDGDPGYEQEELTPEELAAARAAGAAVPQPSYHQQASEPSHAAQPSEASGEVDESGDTVYVGGTRAPVYRHHVREEAREDGPREPAHANPPRPRRR